VDVTGGLAVDLAADRVCGAEDLLDGALKSLGHGAVAHGAGNGVDLLERDVAVVLDVLDLLAVTRGLLEGLDHERRGRGDDLDGGDTVLHGERDGDTETLPAKKKKKELW